MLAPIILKHALHVDQSSRGSGACVVLLDGVYVLLQLLDLQGKHFESGRRKCMTVLQMAGMAQCGCTCHHDAPCHRVQGMRCGW